MFSIEEKACLWRANPQDAFTDAGASRNEDFNVQHENQKFPNLQTYEVPDCVVNYEDQVDYKACCSNAVYYSQ